MKTPIPFIFLSLLLLTSGSIQAQPALPVQIDVDYATFAYGSDESLVELYLAVDASSLHFERGDQAFTAKLPLDLAVVRSSTAEIDEPPAEPVWTDSLTLRFALADTAGIESGQHFIHQLRTAVPPGEYELRLKVSEDRAVERSELELRRDIRVPDFAADDRTLLSDITLATGIEQSDKREDPFYKNGLVVRPNANQLFGEGLPQLFYYAEAYEVDDIAGSDGEYTIYAYISDANRPQPVADLEKRIDRPARDPDILVGSFDISVLPSGSYFLRMVLLNEDNEAIVEQARKFFVYNPGVERVAATEALSFETSEYAAMAEEEVELALEHAGVLANESERRRIRRIKDLDEKRRFLMDFWQARDPQPSTAFNEYKDAFYQRLQYANDRYSSNIQEGWKSDRGRVVLRYGLPTQIDPHLYDRGTLPHEIWHYNNIPGEGQATFVFADRDGFGRFELIHSSVPGERSLPNWQSEISGN